MTKGPKSDNDPVTEDQREETLQHILNELAKVCDGAVILLAYRKPAGDSSWEYRRLGHQAFAEYLYTRFKGVMGQHDEEQEHTLQQSRGVESDEPWNEENED